MSIPQFDTSGVRPATRGPQSFRARDGIAAALLLAGSIGGYAAYGSKAAGAAAPGAAAAPVEAASRTIGRGDDTYAPVVERVAPTVVTIRSERRARLTQHRFMQDPFFRDFFGSGERGGEGVPAPSQRGLGSGVIVREDGYVLTNHHVIDGAEEITVELSDRRSFTAKVVGSDPPSDLAVLKIDGRGLPALTLGDSDAVRVGDVVLAVGNPMGVGQTVTMGIVSAKGRATGLGDGSFEDFLQTDAPINQGNSGGALVNTRGELIGINSQILSPSGGNIGIGFAIPADMARSVMDALISDGAVRRGMLGVTVQGVTPDIASSLGLKQLNGALVSDVQPGSAAEQAGIRRGDVILALDGNEVSDSNSLRNDIAQLKPGARAGLRVLRDGTERTLTATLDELPGPASAQGEAGDGASRDTGPLGLSLQPVSPAQAERLGMARAEGLFVAAVAPSSAAADAGFRRGDVILEIDRKAATRAADVRAAADRAGDRPVLVLVRRGDANLFLTLDAHA